MKYNVTYIYSASKSVQVDAESVDDAIEKGSDEGCYASLCHHCSHEVDLGDAYDYVVEDENGNQVYPVPKSQKG